MRALVRWLVPGDKLGMVAAALRSCAHAVLDFALPPRCPACGTIVADPHAFCSECWGRIHFLGNSGCVSCGLPLEATDADTCAACLTQPPRLSRIRAAVAYDDLTRGLVIRLKYGRKVAVARTMARYMAPLVAGDPTECALIPVPLHRTRLWGRGFNQSALLANELSRLVGIAADPFLLRRTKRTPALKGMSRLQRAKAVAGAFKVVDPGKVRGKRVILVDDVLTTGGTAGACQRALARAGAAQVELVSWARVVTPAQLMR